MRVWEPLGKTGTVVDLPKPQHIEKTGRPTCEKTARPENPRRKLGERTQSKDSRQEKSLATPGDTHQNPLTIRGGARGKDRTSREGKGKAKEKGNEASIWAWLNPDQRASQDTQGTSQPEAATEAAPED